MRQRFASSTTGSLRFVREEGEVLLLGLGRERTRVGRKQMMGRREIREVRYIGGFCDGVWLVLGGLEEM